MKCQEVLLKLEDYSYGEAREAERAALASHLRDCFTCQLSYQELLKENEIFSNYERDIDVSPQMWESVHARITQPELTPQSMMGELIAHRSSGVEAKTSQHYKGDHMSQQIFTFIEYESIWSSFQRELMEAFQEFINDPGKFLAELFQGDPLMARRKRYLRFGATAAMFVWLMSTMAYAGWHFWRPAQAINETDRQIQKIADIAPLSEEIINAPKAAQRNHGGGGGGEHAITPPSQGKLPKASLAPPMVSPSSHPPEIKNPSLPVPPTIQVQPELIAKQPENLPLGLPTGVAGPPSDGIGSGGGIGSGNGGGVGQGNGTGYGKGNGFNTGDGTGGIGGPCCDGDDSIVEPSPGVSMPKLLSKEKPKYTEEARRDKVEGVVILQAVFRKDGTVSDIKIVRGLGHGLDEEAVKAASKITFTPGMKSGKPINVRARIEFTFSLL
jgi:TonB family protein